MIVKRNKQTMYIILFKKRYSGGNYLQLYRPTLYWIVQDMQASDRKKDLSLYSTRPNLTRRFFDI